MNAAEWIALGTLALAAAGALVAATRAMVQAPLQTKKAILESEVANLKADNARLKKEHDEKLLKLSTLQAARGAALLLKQAIDTETELTMSVLGTAAASVLVPSPFLRPPAFVFLSIFGKNADKIRNDPIPIDKGIVGRVYKTGELSNTSDASREPEHFNPVDTKAGQRTKAMLTLPLRVDAHVIGVAQFLEKIEDQVFTAEDERAALGRARIIATKVFDFTRDHANFDVLEETAQRKAREATIAFCDLSASSILFDRMDSRTAIKCIDEYLINQTEIAIRYGATIDKYLGDGVMLRFNVPRPITDGEHAVRAVEAALDMRREFGQLKKSWQDFTFPVDPVFMRIGLACGQVYEANMGHPQFQNIIVIGETVKRAADLCQVGPRDRNVILVDEVVRQRLRSGVRTQELSQPNSTRTAGQPPAYEVLSSA